MKTKIAKIAVSLLLAAASIPAVAATAFKSEVKGSGEPVILIPGLASSGEVWQDTAARMCVKHQCHILTLAGFAGVPALAGESLLPAAEKQLADYISTNKLVKPTVIGHSLGGFLGLKLASDYPDKVGRLVIIDTLPALGATRNPAVTKEQLQAVATQMRDGMRGQDDATFSAMQQRSAANLVTSPEHAQRIANWGKQSDRATVTDAMYDIMSSDLREDVGRIKAPTLVLGTWVAYKAYAPKEAIEGLFKSQYAKLPGVKVELADTARHFMMYDEPEWMYARIDQFIQ
ncbi:alpha/beta fold hydrolase [Pseudoduganella violaceinigra]|uniref:alpha/beta fold hydrolase n=1 Tax=Pseudoduganella violaceinigra TaxID=246602 RepID=UPI0004220A77|nr:alpha/beta hydrolase [Pseudoduganella violaceinigra]